MQVLNMSYERVYVDNHFSTSISVSFVDWLVLVVADMCIKHIQSESVKLTVKLHSFRFKCQFLQFNFIKLHRHWV